MTDAAPVTPRFARHYAFAMLATDLSACRQVVSSRPQGTSERADSMLSSSLRRASSPRCSLGLVPLRDRDRLRLVRLVDTVLRQWIPAVVFESSPLLDKSRFFKGSLRLLPVSFRMGSARAWGWSSAGLGMSQETPKSDHSGRLGGGTFDSSLLRFTRG